MLNKSQILQGINCYKSLYLTINHPEVDVDGGNEMLVKRGIEVGKLARTFFANGVLINAMPDVEVAVDLTKHYLKQFICPLV